MAHVALMALIFLLGHASVSWGLEIQVLCPAKFQSSFQQNTYWNGLHKKIFLFQN